MGSLLTDGCWWGDDKVSTVFFYKKCERSDSMGCIVREEVPWMALRVLRPKSPHSEERAQHIEWRTPRGYAAVWL